MQYPDPQIFIRRVFLDRRTGPRPVARYRASVLNPMSCWGMPVPTFRPETESEQPGADPNLFLIFDKYIAPLRQYLNCLLATEHLPTTADPNTLTLDLIDPDTLRRVESLRSLVGPAREGGQGAEYQKGLQSCRDKLIAQVFNRKVDKMDWAGTSKNAVEKLIKEICIVTCMTPSTVSSALYAVGVDLTRATRMQHEPSKFSTSYEHGLKSKMLKSAIQAFRSAQPSVGQGGSFRVNDLLTSDPGGYPLRCPVTGVELDWTFAGSYYSPKVSKRFASDPASSQNICIMSMVGKRIITGDGSAQTIGRWFNSVREVEPFYVAKILQKVREWIQRHPDPIAADMFKELQALGYNVELPTTPAPAPTPAPAMPATPTADRVAPELRDSFAKILEGWD